MVPKKRLADPKVLIGLLCGALLLNACARAPSVARRPAPVPVPAAIQTVFVGDFGGNPLAREMRDALSAELQKSSRFRVVETEGAADAVLSGFIGVGQTTGSVMAPPSGRVQLLVRGSGRIVWQYQYRDQQSSGELAVPTPQQQVRTIARQFVTQLLSVSGPTAVDARDEF